MNDMLIRERFDGLSDLEKTELMNSLAEKFLLKFKRLGNFSRWGNGITTGIFERDSVEFVFVPGDTVTLGWESFSEGLTADSEEELRETFDAFEFDDTYEDFIGSDMTPVRTVDIPPMLVERKPRELCGDKLSVDDPRILPEWREALTKAICGRELPTALTLIDRVRFTRTGDVWQAELLGGVTYSGLLENLSEQGYSLPTADEWRIFAEAAAERCSRGETVCTRICVSGILTKRRTLSKSRISSESRSRTTPIKAS